MSTNSEESRACVEEARDSRRWLIGIGISLVFGLFGVVMALLSYSVRASPAAPPAAQARPAAEAPAKRSTQAQKARSGRAEPDRRR